MNALRKTSFAGPSAGGGVGATGMVGAVDERTEKLPRTGHAPKARGHPRASPTALRELLALLIKIAVICAIAVLVFTFLYGLHRSAAPDMVPSIKDGDLVMYYRLDRDYAAGDLAVLDFRGERQIRRVVAKEGDTVDITEYGLVINGAIQQEMGIYEKTERYEDGTELPVTLGEGQIFLLGDARENATDSRIYGAVDEKDTLGTVITVIRRRNL
jgi:signal peptidase I